MNFLSMNLGINTPYLTIKPLTRDANYRYISPGEILLFMLPRDFVFRIRKFRLGTSMTHSDVYSLK